MTTSRPAAAALGLLLEAHGARAQSAEPQQQPPARAASSRPFARAQPPAPTARERTSVTQREGSLRLGPTFGLGAPALFNLGALLRFNAWWSVGAAVGVTPTLKFQWLGETALSYRQYDLYGRWHPFGGGFFLGADIGYRVFKASVIDRIDTSALASSYQELGIPPSVDYQGSVQLHSFVLTPSLGYYHTTASGFGIGFFVGAQVPLSSAQIQFEHSVPSVPRRVSDRYLPAIDQRLNSSFSSVGGYVLPSVGVQLGWEF